MKTRLMNQDHSGIKAHRNFSPLRFGQGRENRRAGGRLKEGVPGNMEPIGSLQPSRREFWSQQGVGAAEGKKGSLPVFFHQSAANSCAYRGDLKEGRGNTALLEFAPSPLTQEIVAQSRKKPGFHPKLG